jgi:hypothetical protein
LQQPRPASEASGSNLLYWYGFRESSQTGTDCSLQQGRRRQGLATTAERTPGEIEAD